MGFDLFKTHLLTFLLFHCILSRVKPYVLGENNKPFCGLYYRQDTSLYVLLIPVTTQNHRYHDLHFTNEEIQVLLLGR